MAAIIVYGSLINPEQLHQKPHLFARAYPIFVKGYRRVFNQEPSWRKGDDKHRAVLNVMKSDQDGFNGLLVRLQDGSDFHQLDERERGYNRIAITQAQLAPFVPMPDMGKSDTSKSDLGKSDTSKSELVLAEGRFPEGVCSEAILSDPIFIYVGKPEKQNDDILPNKTYLELCFRGAKHWGEAFKEQFLQTTYVGDLTLKTFLPLKAFLQKAEATGN